MFWNVTKVKLTIEQRAQKNGKCFAGKNAGKVAGVRGEIERVRKRRNFKCWKGTCNYIHWNYLSLVNASDNVIHVTVQIWVIILAKLKCCVILNAYNKFLILNIKINTCWKNILRIFVRVIPTCSNPALSSLLTDVLGHKCSL